MTVPRKCSQRNWNIPILALNCIHPYSTVVFGPIHTNTKPFSLTLVYTYFGCCGSAHSTKGIQPEGDTDLQVHTVRANLSHAMYFSKTLSLRLLQTWNKYPCGFQEVRITFILLSSKCIKKLNRLGHSMQERCFYKMFLSYFEPWNNQFAYPLE